MMADITQEDVMYMRRCLQLARCGEVGAAPNPMVGAVVVCGGKIIGEGYHIRCGGPHAEVNAIASVRDKSLLPASAIYVSLEPCAHYGKTPPCADLIIEKGIPKVVVGCQDPFAKVNGLGIRKLVDAGIDVTVGVLEDECLWLNRKFITFHQKKRPWVTLKWAQSEDGYMDAGHKPGESATCFSSPFTQTLVHRMRTMHKAVMVGTNTALCDNPQLTSRLWNGDNPLRITIDRHGVLPDTLHIMDGNAPSLVYRDGDIRKILSDLFGRNVQSLMVEGGAKLLESFISEGLWDEARVETAPFDTHGGVRAPSTEMMRLFCEDCLDGRKIQVFVPQDCLYATKNAYGCTSNHNFT